MSMTTTEAQTVLRLVDLIGNAGPRDEQQLHDLAEHAVWLAHRAFKTLGAGTVPDTDDVLLGLQLLTTDDSDQTKDPTP